jgi:signal transduction histidine kinase
VSRFAKGWLKHSTTARFVLLYVALSVVGTIPVLYFIYHQTERIVATGYQSTVADRTAILMGTYRAGGLPELAREVEERSSGVLAHGVLLLVDRNGGKIAGNIGAWPPSLDGSRWKEMLLYRDGHNTPERFGLSTVRLPSGDRLLVGVVVDDRGPIREAMLVAMIGALLLAIPIGLIGSLVLVRFMNSRVNEVGEVAARIASGDLSRRVEAEGTNDPFDRLGMSLNAMLARIEALVEELRLVTDALAHDLRSPLMRIRAFMEKADEQPGDGGRGRAMDAISKEIDGMLRMIAGTLEISRAEAGMGRENFTSFDIGALVRDLCEMYQPLAEQHHLSIAVDAPRPIAYFGNRELIGQAVSNLVDNAVKYGSGGGTVRIGADDDGAAVRLWVADDGPGIPGGRREEAVRKYRRLDEARASDGSGLGLALVRAVASLHGGELRLEDNAPGLRAVMILPRTNEAE